MLVHHSRHYSVSILQTGVLRSCTANFGRDQRDDQSGDGCDCCAFSDPNGVATGDENAHQAQTDRPFPVGSFVS